MKRCGQPPDFKPAPADELERQAAAFRALNGETPTSTYPEHEKLRAIQDQSQKCGEFFEWLTGTKRYTVGEYHRHDESCTEDGTKGVGRFTCGSSTSVLYPVSCNTRKLLAEFFEIDEAKLEDEKRAMLAALR
jgi:hypothetical protein